MKRLIERSEGVRSCPRINRKQITHIENQCSFKKAVQHRPRVVKKLFQNGDVFNLRFAGYTTAAAEGSAIVAITRTISSVG
ncbi:hypothetical protein N9068_01370 [bacterium]|nr:hypothetical protein [bacterium]